MANLSRMELAALKRMEKSLIPLRNQLSKYDEKLVALLEARGRVAEQYNKMEEVMNTYTGGVPYQEILHPAGNAIAVDETAEVAEEITGEADDTEVAEMVEVAAEDALPWNNA